MSVIAHAPSNTLVIGEVSHYHFYQSMNQTPSRPSQKYQPTKTIIPSVPRQHFKAPPNSPLSFIRQQKLPQNNHPTAAAAGAASSSSSPPQNLSSTSVLSSSLPTTSSSSPQKAVVPAFQSSSSSLFLNSGSSSSSQPSRPPFFAHSSADLLTNLPIFPKKHSLVTNRRRRPRKVSFDENVMVICTRFDDDDNDDDDEDSANDKDTDRSTVTNILNQPEGAFLSAATTHSSSVTPFYHGRRHSTGEHITDEQRQRKRWRAFVTHLKHWKYTIAPSSPSSLIV